MSRGTLFTFAFLFCAFISCCVFVYFLIKGSPGCACSHLCLLVQKLLVLKKRHIEKVLNTVLEMLAQHHPPASFHINMEHPKS